MKKSCLAVVCAITFTSTFTGRADADPIGVEALLLSWGPALPYTETPGQTVEFTKDKGTLPGKKYGDGHVTLMKRESAPPTVNPISGHLEILSLVDVFSDITLDTGVVITLSGQGTVLFTETDPSSNLFEAEILSFELSAPVSDPLLLVRESPTRASLGTVAVLPALSLPGQPPQYHIDSFFDVFTELSDDGGQTWDPADLLPGEADVLPLHVTANGVVPEPATLSLLLAGVLPLTSRRARTSRPRRHS